MNPTTATVSQKKIIAKKFFLLPVLPIIFFFLHNANQYMELVFTWDVLFLLFLYLLLSYFIFASGKILLKLTVLQSLFISTLAIIFFLFFGALQDYLFQFKRFSFFSNSFFLFAIVVAILLFISLFLKKKKARPVAANSYFIVLFIVLIFLEIILLSAKFFSGKSLKAITSRMATPVLNNEKIISSENPDIYHIIFDEYTNLPALKKYWGYDDEIYLFLTSKGFFTLDSAISNYTSSPFSIASIFCLQYLKGAEPYLERNTANFLVGHMVYSNNDLFQFLKQLHYHFSIFSLVDNKDLSTGLGFLGLEKSNNILRQQTIERIFLNPWVRNKLNRFFGAKDEEPALITKSKQKFADYNKKALEHIFFDCRNSSKQHLTSPVFSYTHILLPHEPYMFDENGKLLPLAQQDEGVKGYLRQVQYSNKLIQQITDCLLSDTTRKKIIIFQGDHGYRDYPDAPVTTSYEALSAIYFYNKNYIGLKKNFSHVNTYRVIINNFFGGKLPLLQDSIVLMKKK